MKSVFLVTKEIFTNFGTAHRLAVNDLVIRNKGNFFGIFWVWANPAVQIFIYGIVFGQGLRNSQPVEGVSFFIWLITGFIMWSYINSVVTSGSRSILNKIGLITKMKFPVSIIPAVVVLSELYVHLLMLFTIIIILFAVGIEFNYFWFNSIYFLFSATCFLYAFSVFNSAITVTIRDYQHVVYNTMRSLFFLTPVVYPISSMKGLSYWILRLNPFTYLLEGYRDSFLYARRTMLMSFRIGAYFWIIVIILYVVGSILHIRMRKNLLDYA